MSKCFEYVNEIDPTTNTESHIYPWKSSGLIGVVGYGYKLQLLLEWMLLTSGNRFIMVLIDNTTKSYWNKILIEMTCFYCFNNTFSTDSGNPAKNINILDSLYDEDPDDTRCCIHFYN